VREHLPIEVLKVNRRARQQAEDAGEAVAAAELQHALALFLSQGGTQTQSSQEQHEG
jgi:hypothetical protein